MTVELETTNRQPTTELMNAIFEITSGFQKTTTAIDKAFMIGKEQGFTDKEISIWIREQMLAAGFDARTIRRVLPTNVKGTQGGASITSDKTDKMSVNENTVNIPTEYNVVESSSESATGPEGEEIEREVEVVENNTVPQLKKRIQELEKRPLGHDELYNQIHLLKKELADYRGEVSELNKALNEERELRKELEESNRDLRFTKASEIPQQPTQQVIILPHMMALEVYDKRMKLAVDGIMKLQVNNGVVEGVEVVNGERTE